MSLVFATNNKHKLEEISHLLEGTYEIIPLETIGCHDDIPEDHETLEENALQKARYIKEHYGCDCFADDTGLEIEALNGQPGVYSARYAGPAKDSKANMQKVLDNMQNQANRKACFRTIIASFSMVKNICLKDVSTEKSSQNNTEVPASATTRYSARKDSRKALPKWT